MYRDGAVAQWAAPVLCPLCTRLDGTLARVAVTSGFHPRLAPFAFPLPRTCPCGALARAAITDSPLSCSFPRSSRLVVFLCVAYSPLSRDPFLEPVVVVTQSGYPPTPGPLPSVLGSEPPLASFPSFLFPVAVELPLALRARSL